MRLPGFPNFINPHANFMDSILSKPMPNIFLKLTLRNFYLNNGEGNDKPLQFLPGKFHGPIDLALFPSNNIHDAYILDIPYTLIYMKINA